MKLWLVTGAIAAHAPMKKMIDDNKALLDRAGLSIEVYERFDINYTTGLGKDNKIYVNGKEAQAPDVLFLYGSCDAAMEGIEKALAEKGTVSLNPTKAKRISESKLMTAQLLDKYGIPQAKTLVIMRDTPADFIISELGLPVVVKPDMGYGGAGVELLHTEEELKEYLASIPEHPDDMILAQPYISTSKGRDLRVIMVGGTPFAWVIRQAGDPNEFRSNVHQGGHYEDFEMTPEIEELCKKAVKASGLKLCGLDFLFTESGLIVGEINDSPGMRKLLEKEGPTKFFKAFLS